MVNVTDMTVHHPVAHFCLDIPTGLEIPRRLDDGREYESPIELDATALAHGKAELLSMLFASQRRRCLAMQRASWHLGHEVAALLS